MFSSAEILQGLFSLRNVFIYVTMCLSLPSVLLYCSECVLIIRRKTFRNSFYSLFVVRAIPDLLYVLDSYYGYRLPTVIGAILLPLYETFPNWLLAIFYVASGYAFISDNLATCFMLFNRLTAIILPLAHENLWKKLTPLSVLIVFFLPAFFTFSTFNMNAVLNVNRNDPLNGNGTSFIIYEDAEGQYLHYNTALLATCAIVFLIGCIAINLVTFWAYQKQISKGMNGTGANTKGAIEKKLLVYAILTFLGHMLVALLMVAMYIYYQLNNYDGIQACYCLYPLIVDLGTIVLPSWLLLWASPSFRKQWAADYLPRMLVKYYSENESRLGVIKVANAIQVRPNNFNSTSRASSIINHQGRGIATKQRVSSFNSTQIGISNIRMNGWMDKN